MTTRRGVHRLHPLEAAMLEAALVKLGLAHRNLPEPRWKLPMTAADTDMSALPRPVKLL